jgi:hypothetical protein
MNQQETRGEYGPQVPAELKYIGALGAAIHCADVLYRIVDAIDRGERVDRFSVIRAWGESAERVGEAPLFIKEAHLFGIRGEAQEGVVDKYRDLMFDEVFPEYRFDRK